MSRWANKYVIGLTGNIAVGKSVVRQMVQHLGAYTIDADGLTHRAMAPGAPAYRPIVETFGQFILDAEKNIDRNMLGNIVFSRPDALAKLEAIVHPVVGQAIGTLVSRASQPVVVIEAIKLLEGELGAAVDEIWVVDAAPETQLRRLIGARKMSEADARQRITAQGAQSDKLAKAAVVIKNDGNVEDTWRQVQTAWVNVQKKLHAPTRPADAPATSVAQPPARPPQTGTITPAKVIVRRGMPTNAETIAQFISQATGKTVGRMDVMMAFGQKSYLIAQDASEHVLGLVGWQVENLITRVDEFYLLPNLTPAPVVQELLTAIEQASKDLQSEVGYIFLPSSTTPETVQTFTKNGYDRTAVEQIKIPAWREAVQELMSNDSGLVILTKKLREDRVLKPI